MSIITQFTSFIFSWLMRNLGGLFIKRSLDETSPLNELYTEILNEVYWFDFTVIQCSTVQCSVVQYSVVQYSVVQYSVVQYSVVQYSVVQYSVVQCSVVQCSVHSTVQYITLQYNSTVQYSTVQCSAHSAVLVKLFLKLLLLNGLVWKLIGILYWQVNYSRYQNLKNVQEVYCIFLACFCMCAY